MRELVLESDKTLPITSAKLPTDFAFFKMLPSLDSLHLINYRQSTFDLIEPSLYTRIRSLRIEDTDRFDEADDDKSFLVEWMSNVTKLTNLTHLNCPPTCWEEYRELPLQKLEVIDDSSWREDWCESEPRIVFAGCQSATSLTSLKFRMMDISTRELNVFCNLRRLELNCCNATVSMFTARWRGGEEERKTKERAKGKGGEG